MNNENISLVHGSAVTAYGWHAIASNENKFLYTANPEVVRAWKGTIILLGACDLTLVPWFASRPKSQRLVLVVIDMANTMFTLQLMQEFRALAQYVRALNSNRRSDVASMLNDLFKPDIFVVNNALMASDFNDANTGALIVNLHPPANCQIRMNFFDKLYGATALPRSTALGGLQKYIREDVREVLTTFERQGKIQLIPANIEGGSLGEKTVFPPEPQIVVSCRAPRLARIGDYKINYTDIERAWKPATKYLNAIYSGSHYIGTIEQSAWELAQDDELALFIENINDLTEALEVACVYDPRERHLRSLRRRAAAELRAINEQHYVSALRALSC